MKQHKMILMALAVALTPLAGWAATEGTTDASPPALVVPPDLKLSRPARDVVKMTAAGVPDDVIKAYVDNAPAPFNLSADNIIHMQGVGVSTAVTSEMLAHDKKMSDQMAMAGPPGYSTPPPAAPYPYPPSALETAPPNQPVNSAPAYTTPDDTSGYYSDLAPYGSWSYLPDYGWCWEPSIGLGYAYYPWGILQYGRWWNWPGRGWVWFPGRGGFRGGYRGFASGFAGTRGFAGGRGFAGASFAANRSVSVTRIGGGFHSAGGFARSGGGHFGGGRSFGGGHSFGRGGHR